MINGNTIRQANVGGNTWVDCSEEAFKRAKESDTPVREVHLNDESFRAAFDVWQDKTDWVQKDRRFDVLEPWGMHRADVLKAFIEHLEGRIAELEESNSQVIQSPVVPDGLIKAVEFYEQVKRENPPVETSSWKDAVDWVLKEACRAAMLNGGKS